MRDARTKQSHAPGFWLSVWWEVEPIVRHSIAVLVLLASLTVFALLLRLLGQMLSKNDYFVFVETIEIWLAVVIFCMYGAYTIAELGGILFRRLRGTDHARETRP